MMRGLAEFIMRGRWQALGVAILGSGSLLFGWISAAAIALVTLRRGTAAGGWLVLWALLPALVITAMTGDTGSVMLLAGAFGLDVVLRETVNLSLAVMASVGRHCMARMKKTRRLEAEAGVSIGWPSSVLAS